jgi:hypothetical protein
LATDPPHSEAPAAYEVGYGKPPKDTRFKPGRSGNPKGRSKGAKNFKTDLIEELSESIIVREGGKSRRISKQRAMIKRLVEKSLSGELRALALFLSTALKHLPESETNEEAPLAQEDLDILNAYLARNGYIRKD